MQLNSCYRSASGTVVRPPEPLLQNELLLRRCRDLAGEDPARALVLLWRHLRQQGAIDQGFSRDRCIREAEQAGELLAMGKTPQAVHPVALLRAVDEHLAMGDLGQEPLVRQVELPAAPPSESGSFFVVPRPQGWASRLALSQPGHLEFWMRRHHVIPTVFRGISIEIQRLSWDLRKSLAAARMPFAAGGFLDGILPDWSERSPYHCRQLTNPDGRWRSVRKLVEVARKRGTTLVVLPELTIDPQVRAHLRDWLREQLPSSGFGLLVAGSFHEARTGDGAVGGQGHNIARILDGYGDEVLQHKKLRPMRTTAGEAVLDEDIEAGSYVRLLDAPFGLVGTAICLDFCEIGDAPVAELWQALGPALMLVPSMGNDGTNHAHRERAKPLALQHGTATLVASQDPVVALARGMLWDQAARASARKPVLHGVLEWTDC